MRAERVYKLPKDKVNTCPMTALKSFLRAVAAVNAGGWSLERGVTGALGCCVPLLAAQWFGNPMLAWSGLIGFWATMVDPGWPARRRLAAIGAFTGTSAVGCALATLVRGFLWPSGLFALLWCLPAILACVWGETAGTIGTLSATAVLIVLSAAHPASAGAAVQMALLTAGGGLWGMAVAFAIGRQRPETALPAALAAIFQAEAAFLRDLAHGGPPAQRRGAAREAIETARKYLFAARGHCSAAQHGSLLLADAEGLLRTLLALREALHTAPSPPPELLPMAATLEAIAQRLAGRRLAIPPLPSIPSGEDEDGVITTIRAAASWVETAQRHLIPPGQMDGQATPAQQPGQETPWPARWLGPLRNNLPGQSLSLRHAARFAITGAALTMLIKASGIEMGHWITITAVMILQAYPSATWQRSIQRVAGTVLGGLIAAGAAFWLHGPEASLIAVVPLSLMAMGLRNVNYAVYVVFSTPLFMILVELVENGGVLPPTLGELRIVYNLLGAAIGMFATITLWPSWESAFMRRHLAEAVRENTRFLLMALDAWLGNAPPGTAEDARRLAGLASNNAEASLRRAMHEPRRYLAGEISSAMAIAASTRRLSGIAALLLALPQEPGIGAHAASRLRQFIQAAAEDQVNAIMQKKAADFPPPPVLPGDQACGRLLNGALRQFSIIAEAAVGLTAHAQAPTLNYRAAASHTQPGES